MGEAWRGWNLDLLIIPLTFGTLRISSVRWNRLQDEFLVCEQRARRNVDLLA